MLREDVIGGTPEVVGYGYLTPARLPRLVCWRNPALPSERILHIHPEHAPACPRLRPLPAQAAHPVENHRWARPRGNAVRPNVASSSNGPASWPSRRAVNRRPNGADKSTTLRMLLGLVARPRELPPSTANPSVTCPTHSTPSERSSIRLASTPDVPPRPPAHPGSRRSCALVTHRGSLGTRRSRVRCQPAGGHLLSRHVPRRLPQTDLRESRRDP
jgi:hypothetical protein